MSNIYNFLERKQWKAKEDEYPSLCQQKVKPQVGLDYGKLKDTFEEVVEESKKEVYEEKLPLPPKRIIFPIKEFYDWSNVPRHF